MCTGNVEPLASYTITTTTVLWPFFRDHLGEPVPEENFWTLRWKGGLTEADTPTIWMGATPLSCNTNTKLNTNPNPNANLNLTLTNQTLCQHFNRKLINSHFCACAVKMWLNIALDGIKLPKCEAIEATDHGQKVKVRRSSNVSAARTL